MPIETDEEITIKAEIAAGLFMEAFEALLAEWARRDGKGLAAAAPALLARLERFSTARFRPGPQSGMTAHQLQHVREAGQQQAFEAITRSIRRAIGHTGKSK